MPTHGSPPTPAARWAVSLTVACALLVSGLALTGWQRAKRASSLAALEAPGAMPAGPDPLSVAPGVAGRADSSIADSTATDRMAAQPMTAHDLRLAWFRYHLRAFAADLMRTGRVEPLRARQLAYVAVGEAYRHGVPPALVLGVMTIENDRFRSTAVSSAGAMGLMQVMPNIWLRSLGPKYGWDLRNDETNLKMGVHILREMIGKTDGEWRTALLRYNGCVRGTRTPDCFRYPDKVRRVVERQARYTCPWRDFDLCVGRPLAATFARR